VFIAFIIIVLVTAGAYNTGAVMIQSLPINDAKGINCHLGHALFTDVYNGESKQIAHKRTA